MRFVQNVNLICDSISNVNQKINHKEYARKNDTPVSLDLSARLLSAYVQCIPNGIFMQINFNVQLCCICVTSWNPRMCPPVCMRVIMYAQLIIALLHNKKRKWFNWILPCFPNSWEFNLPHKSYTPFHIFSDAKWTTKYNFSGWMREFN